MKNKFLLPLLFLTTLAFAQLSGELTVNWTDKSAIQIGNIKVIVPQFNPLNYQFDNYTKALFYTIKVSVPFEINEKSIQISSINYEDIGVSDLGELALKAIPSTIDATVKNVAARGVYLASLTFSPIIKDGNGYKRVKSLNYNLAQSNNRLLSTNTEFTELSNSVLASGNWHRFFVTKSGVYRIDRNFLNQLGINLDGIDPRKLKIYGNGGRMIPLKNSDFYPADLAENAITVVGESDGVFNDTDYVLFYAEGVDQWSQENQTSTNLYDSKSYYYVNIEGVFGKRISEFSQPTSATVTSINTYDDIRYYEKDLVNIARLGRRWFGEKFDFIDQLDFNFSLPNVVAGSTVNLNIYAAAVSLIATSMEVKANNVLAGNLPFTPINASVKADWSILNTIIPAAEATTISIKYNNNGVPDSRGYLDYIQLKSKRNLIGYRKQFPFQYDLANASTTTAEYVINNATSISQVWDITDIYNISSATNPNQSAFSFKVNLGAVRKYVAVDISDYYYPSIDSQSRVANQNLKGTIFLNNQGQFQDLDYLIVCPTFLTTQAEKLANFHRTNSQLNVKVVTLESIYQEFCSGKQDIGAIRNFVKYVYFNASSPEKRIKYLNLFGDASFDFKNRVSAKGNIVPIYHALNSFTADPSSFCSDDFFGLMDNNEGNVDQAQGGLDIAVGRMLVNNNQQGEELVNKVLEYNDIKSYGNWRNNIVIVADDSDQASDSSLQTNLNNMVENIVAAKPFFNYKKILLDSYVQETSSGGSRYPKARKDMFDSFEKGALVFNYLGHGGEDGLSQERIWEKSDGENLSNRYKYPLFITITCDFSRFDNPFRPTAGEFTYWNPKGGAISMFTTVREIFQSTGENFNNIIAPILFSFNSNEYVTMAEALRLAKISYSPRTDVIFYLGDPALKLDIPKPRVNLTKINDAPINGPVNDFKSLAFMKLSGEITDEFNNPLTSYNGDLSIQIFDKKITQTTLNNDNNSPAINFNVLGETIYRGNASITNGQFEFGFVVPRDISIPVDNGRISFYAKRNQVLLDKSGFNNDIKVGGINLNAAADNTAPKVRLYMNDQTFVSGGITNESPLFLAYLEDENGINTASGIGHDIVCILDGDESNPIKLNDYYETELDNYKMGKIKFPFRNLAKGLHTLSFKAWDVYNNIVTSELQFTVVGDESITITNVLNYPNPFVNYTQFWFTHNRPFEPLEVQVQVLTITGKLVWTKNQTVTTDGFLSKDITWDGKDDFGDKIGKGVYIYKLTVKSVLTNSQIEKYEKLVIL